MSNNLLFLLPSRIRQSSAAWGATSTGLAALVWLQLNGRLGTADFHMSAVISTVVLGAAVLILIAFRAFPGLTRQLEERRIAQMSERQFAVYTALKIPIATALAEEALFRGALWYAIQLVAGPMWALVVTAIAFGMWHIVVSAHQGREFGARAMQWVLVSVATTTLAGLGFGWLRMVTGGILAPIVAHCAINVVGSIGARIRARLDARPASSSI